MRRPLEVWITGGGTREPIDAVRWIGNVSTGRLALALARAAARGGDRVRLFLAEPVQAPKLRRLTVDRFVTAADLRDRLRAARPRPDVIVHAAAVSDYAPAPRRGKVRSGLASWTLRLRPLPKIADELRRRHPRAVLCTFKLETGIAREELVRRAGASAARNGADLVFANLLEEVGERHRGILIDPAAGPIAQVRSRDEAARTILDACRARVAPAGHGAPR